MNYLAVDTASKTLKVLVKKDDKKEYYENNDFKTASECLMPAVDEALKKVGATLEDMDFFACVSGPGSFTGIRIGMATVKAFAYALNKPVVTVTALEVLAYNNRGEETVVAVSDASNGMRYVAVFDDKMRSVMDTRCLEASELDEFIMAIDEPYAVYSDVPAPNAVLPTEHERAFTLAVENASGRAIDGNKAEPLYVRKPQAERDLEK